MAGQVLLWSGQMDRIISMLLRMIMRKVMNKGVSKGIDMLAKKPDNGRPLTKEERVQRRLQKRRLRERGQQARRVAKLTRRIGRF